MGGSLNEDSGSFRINILLDRFTPSDYQQHWINVWNLRVCVQYHTQERSLAAVKTLLAISKGLHPQEPVSYALCEEEEGKRDANPQCKNFSSLQLNICQNWTEENLLCLKFIENVPQNNFSPHCPSFKRKVITLFSVFSLYSVKHTNAARMRVGIMFWMCNRLFSREALFYDLIIVWQGFVWRRGRQFNWIFYFTGRI